MARKKRKSRPLLVATAGAATVVFGCARPPVPDRIGPPPMPSEEQPDASASPTGTSAASTSSTATPVEMRTVPPQRIGPPVRIGMAPPPTKVPHRIGPPPPPPTRPPHRIGPPTTWTPTPTQSPAATTGKLAIHSDPWGDVYIDGVKKGVTPLMIELDPGRHHVRIVNEDKKVDAELTVRIEAGSTVAQKVELTPYEDD